MAMIVQKMSHDRAAIIVVCPPFDGHHRVQMCPRIALRCAKIVMNCDRLMKPCIIVDASLMTVNHDL